MSVKLSAAARALFANTPKWTAEKAAQLAKAASGADNRLRRRKQLPDPSSTLGASILCAWQIEGDIWHVQSRDPWLSGVLLDMGMKRIARAIKGGHLHIFETRGGFETVRPLMRRHKGRILR